MNLPFIVLSGTVTTSVVILRMRIKMEKKAMKVLLFRIDDSFLMLDF